MKRFKKEFKNYEIVISEEIRYDFHGSHHTGFDVIDAAGQYWGIFEDAKGELFLAR